MRSTVFLGFGATIRRAVQTGDVVLHVDTYDTIESVRNLAAQGRFTPPCMAYSGRADVAASQIRERSIDCKQWEFPRCRNILCNPFYEMHIQWDHRLLLYDLE